MYNSLLLCPHDLSLGTREINGNLCEISKGKITCASVRIQKAWARRLSVQYGVCQYEWSNDKASGSVIYENGKKTAEMFKAA